MKKGQMCMGDLPKEKLGGEWVKREERAEGLKSEGDPEDVADPALVSNDAYVA